MEKGVEYIQSEKFSLKEFKKVIPKDLIPTKKMTYALAGILIIVLIYNFSQFPLSNFLSMQSLDEKLIFEIGWPKPMFVLDFFNPETFPLNFNGIFVDFLIYLVLAYLIDVVLNAFLNSDTFRELTEKGLKDSKPKIIK
ncbi:hypothetical protein H8D36_07310 [archaeon]|nr:hypothetical protein [archaeon]